MKQTPLVSVVIPTHNRSAQLALAVKSVLAQTHQKLEIFVIDDASTDDTNEVVNWFPDSRIHYVRHKQNVGGSATRNTGIRLAQGMYIAFLDDDDQWKPNKIEKQLEQIADCDAVICGYRLFVEEREVPGAKEQGKSFHVTRRLLKRGQVGWGTSTLMAKTDIAMELRFDESLPVGQDWDLLIRMAERYRVKYFDESLVMIGVADQGRISTSLIDAPLEDIEKRMKVLTKHSEYLGSFWYKLHESRMLLSRIRQRKDRWQFALYTIRRCGIAPVIAGWIQQLYTQLAGYRY